MGRVVLVLPTGSAMAFSPFFQRPSYLFCMTGVFLMIRMDAYHTRFLRHDGGASMLSGFFWSGVSSVYTGSRRYHGGVCIISLHLLSIG